MMKERRTGRGFDSPRAGRSHVETGGSAVFLPGILVEEVVLEAPVRRTMLPPGALRGHVVRKETRSAVLPAATPWHTILKNQRKLLEN